MIIIIIIRRRITHTMSQYMTESDAWNDCCHSVSVVHLSCILGHLVLLHYLLHKIVLFCRVQ